MLNRRKKKQSNKRNTHAPAEQNRTGTALQHSHSPHLDPVAPSPTPCAPSMSSLCAEETNAQNVDDKTPFKDYLCDVETSSSSHTSNNDVVEAVEVNLASNNANNDVVEAMTTGHTNVESQPKRVSHLLKILLLAMFMLFLIGILLYHTITFTVAVSEDGIQLDFASGLISLLDDEHTKQVWSINKDFFFSINTEPSWKQKVILYCVCSFSSSRTYFVVSAQFNRTPLAEQGPYHNMLSYVSKDLHVIIYDGSIKKYHEFVSELSFEECEKYPNLIFDMYIAAISNDFPDYVKFHDMKHLDMLSGQGKSQQNNNNKYDFNQKECIQQDDGTCTALTETDRIAIIKRHQLMEQFKKDQKQELIELLQREPLDILDEKNTAKNCEDNNHQFPMFHFGIFGMHGIGKSTLLRSMVKYAGGNEQRIPLAMGKAAESHTSIYFGMDLPQSNTRVYDIKGLTKLNPISSVRDLKLLTEGRIAGLCELNYPLVPASEKYWFDWWIHHYFPFLSFFDFRDKTCDLSNIPKIEHSIHSFLLLTTYHQDIQERKELKTFISKLKRELGDVSFIVVTRNTDVKERLTSRQIKGFGEYIGAGQNMIVIPTMDRYNKTLLSGDDIWDVPIETIVEIFQKLQQSSYVYFKKRIQC
mmetsp:Transcript_28861/g.34045  ORF Transcript_28861/g.34045 Transcript_28861/m.34045 type:complete len:641 (+) Transcript_28861:51-1973(+)